MKKLNILLTGIGAPGAFGILRCLNNVKERQIHIIGVDANDNAGCKELVDYFEVIPMAKDEMFIPTIMNICKKHDVDVVVPIVTRELQKLSDNKLLFEQNNIKVCVNDSEVLKIINNKGCLFDELSKFHSFKLPQYFIVHSLSEYIDALNKLDYKNQPVCIKATFGNGSRGIRFIDPQKSLFDLFANEKPDSKYVSYSGMMDILKEAKNFPELMIMEYLPGKEIGVDVLADNGEVLYIASRYSSVVKNSIPMVSEIIDCREIEDQCRFIVKKLKLSGNIGFDFRYGRDNYPYLMEINPRLTATVVLNAVAGINFPYLGIKYVLGEPLPKLKIKVGVQLRRRYEETYLDSDRKTKLVF